MRKQQGTANLGAQPEFIRLAQKAPYAQALVPLPASLSPLLVAWEPFLLRHAELEGRRKEFPAGNLAEKPLRPRQQFGYAQEIFRFQEEDQNYLLFFLNRFFFHLLGKRADKKLIAATKDQAATLPAPSLLPLK